MSSLDALRARFAHNEGLPFADILTEASILEVLNDQGVTFRSPCVQPSHYHLGLFESGAP